jgi:hypothetical protein
LNKLNSSFITLAAMGVAGLGFLAHVVTTIAPPDSADTPLPDDLVDQAFLVIEKDGVTKYLKVMDITAGDKATMAIVDHEIHSIHDLFKLDDHKVIGEAVLLEDLLAVGVDEAAEMLGFKLSEAA